MKDFRLSGVASIVAAAITTGCSWVDSSGRQENQVPGLTDLTQIVIEEQESASLGVADADRNLEKFDILQVGEGGVLSAACVAAGGDLADIDPNDFANSLQEACDPLVEQLCELTLEHELLSSELWTGEIPKLRRPVALQYQLDLQDSDGASAEQLLTLCIASKSTAPIASNDVFDVEYDATRVVEGVQFGSDCEVEVAGGVLTNDTDDFDFSEDDANAQQCLVAQLRTPPAHHQGVFALQPDGGFSYSAGTDLGVGQSDSFTYVVSDGVNESEEATVAIRITGQNSPPTSKEPVLTIDEDEVLFLTADDLADDAEVGELVLKNAVAPIPSMGTLEKLLSPARLRYTPNANESGTDSFGYRVEDSGGAFVDVTVALTIDPVNDLPTIVAEQGTSVTLASSGQTDTLLFTVEDVEDDAAGDGIAVSASSDNTNVATVAVSEELNGATDGNWQLTFTAVADGSATVTMTATDTDAESNAVPMTIGVVVGSGNQSPTVDNPSPELTTAMGSDLLIDIIADGIADDPDGSNANIVIDSVNNEVGATVVVAANNTQLTLSPMTVGTASFDLTVTDEDGASATGAITVDVTAAATQAPVLQSPALTAIAGEASTWNIDTDGLATDPDSAEADLFFAATPTSADGSVTLSVDNKSLIFTPTAAGAASIAVVVEDPDGNQVSGSLAVTVSAANVDPSVTATTLSVVQGIPTVFVLGTDVVVADSDGDPATVVVSGFASESNVSVAAVSGNDRGLELTASVVGVASGSFDLQVEDVAGGTGQGTITVDVTANQAPTSSVAALTAGTTGVLLEVTQIDLGIADSDSNVANVLISGATLGAVPLGSTTADLSVSAAGDRFSFTPDLVGDYTINYSVDDEVNSENFTVTITVN